MKYYLSFWFPPLVYMLAIFAVSAMPNPNFTGEIPDYVLHALEYFLLALLLLRLLLAQPPQAGTSWDFAAWQRVCLIGLVLASLYGISDEIHQSFVPGRHCTVADACADLAGAALAYAGALLDYRMLTRHPGWRTRLQQWPRLALLSYAWYRFE
jgi:VanZ family protein